LARDLDRRERKVATMGGEKGIGVGGVVTQIGWLASKEGDPVAEDVVLEGLQRRFSTTFEAARCAIQLAERCGAVERREKSLVLLPRLLRTC
jgi:hypothetical protein